MTIEFKIIEKILLKNYIYGMWLRFCLHIDMG